MRTSGTNCVERLASEMTCYVSSGTLNPTHSLTYFLSIIIIVDVYFCVKNTLRKACVNCEQVSIKPLKKFGQVLGFDMKTTSVSEM